MPIFEYIVYNTLGLFRLSIALGFQGHILVVLNLSLMFCLDSDRLSVLSTQLANVTLHGSLWLFLNKDSSLSFLKVDLNGLKQLTSKGCRAWEVVWDGKVIISSPASYVCLIVFKVTCDPCSFRIKRWLFYWDKPLGIDRIKKERNCLNK
jgi:hypothetical protein